MVFFCLSKNIMLLLKLALAWKLTQNVFHSSKTGCFFVHSIHFNFKFRMQKENVQKEMKKIRSHLILELRMNVKPCFEHWTLNLCTIFLAYTLSMNGFSYEKFINFKIPMKLSYNIVKCEYIFWNDSLQILIFFFE